MGLGSGWLGLRSGCGQAGVRLGSGRVGAAHQVLGGVCVGLVAHLAVGILEHGALQRRHLLRVKGEGEAKVRIRARARV
eukprot:scaffold89822_cov27-Phaeocystis_antarctica.AAC.1